MKKIQIKKALVSTAGNFAGGAAAAYINKIDAVASIDPLLRSLGKAVVGKVVLPMIAKGKGGEFINDIGAGMAGVAGAELLNATVLKDDPVSISGGIPTLGYAGHDYSGGAAGNRIPTLGRTPIQFGEDTF